MRKRQDEEPDTVSAAEPLTLATNASSKLARYLSSRRGLGLVPTCARERALFSMILPSMLVSPFDGVAAMLVLLRPSTTLFINDPSKLACYAPRDGG